MKKTLMVATAILFFLPVMAFAQEEWGAQMKDWELTIHGTGASSNDFDNNSASADASLAYYLTDGLELGLRQGVTWVDRDPGASADDWNGASRLFLDYNFDLERFRPFLGVSAGYLYGDNTDNRWIVGPEAGVKYYLQRKTFLYLIAEYNFTFEDSDEIDDVYDDGRFAYGLGFGVNW